MDSAESWLPLCNYVMLFLFQYQHKYNLYVLYGILSSRMPQYILQDCKCNQGLDVQEPELDS